MGGGVPLMLAVRSLSAAATEGGRPRLRALIPAPLLKASII